MAGPVTVLPTSESESTARRLSLLVLDDSAEDREALRQSLEAAGSFSLAEAHSPAEVRQAILAGPIDLIVTELAVWGTPELAVLDRIRSAGISVPVVVLTGRGSEEWAVKAMKRGAADYIPKRNGYLEGLPARLLAAANHQPPGSQIPREALFYSKILNALSVNIALINHKGIIRAVNDAWRHSAFETPYQRSVFQEGTDYLAVCDQALAAGEIAAAEEIATNFRSVLAGEKLALSIEYACATPEGRRWYKIAASPVRDDDRRGAIVVHVDITARKQAEEERDRIFEQSLNLVCIGRFDGFMQRWNPALGALLGYSTEELMSEPMGKLIHPDDIPGALEKGLKLLAGETISGVEVRIRCRDGSYKWILWNALPDLEQGLYFATGQDITERKQIEQQLRESEERFLLIASATKEAVWDWDLRQNRLWQNEGYLQAFGAPDQSRESVIEWWRSRIHPDDRPRTLAAIPRKAINGQQQWVLEYRLRRLDGSYAHVYDRGFVVFDDAGEPVRMVGSIMDISALKHAQQELRETEERFRLAANATRDAIWDYDLRRNRVWRSEGFQTLFGYQTHEVDEDYTWWAERIHPNDRARVLAQMPAGEALGAQQVSVEYRFRRADGSYADVLDRSFVLSDTDGKPARVIGTVMDISARRRAEEVAHIQRAELAHIARLSTMGEIATGLAHELNQPLTAIANYAESCSRAIAGGVALNQERLLSWIGKIASNTQRAAEMIRRLRGFTRKSEPRRSSAEVNELVEEVLELLEAETRLQNVRIRWQPTRQAYITADRLQIQQVLVNLLYNAYEAMAQNEPADRQATIIVALEPAMVRISVEDRGEGIAPELIDRVFEAFYTSKAKGVGIGLAISRSIVEDHGGRLWATPNTQQGVTFHFTLPLSGTSHD